MTIAVAVFLVLLGSVVEQSDAISCYDCLYNSSNTQTSTCDEPFNAASAPTCDGSTCLFTYEDITSPQSKRDAVHLVRVN